MKNLIKKTWKRSSLISILWAKGDWLLYTLPTHLNMKRCIRIKMVHIKSEPFHIQIHLMDFFNFDEFVEEMPEIKDTYTKLTAYLNKQNTLGRAKTFFINTQTQKAFKQWFIETFFFHSL